MTGAQSAVIVLCRYVANVPVHFMAGNKNKNVFDYYNRLRDIHVEFEDMDAFIEGGDINTCVRGFEQAGFRRKVPL